MGTQLGNPKHRWSVRVDLPGEEPSTKRAPRHKADVQLVANIEDAVLFDVSRPQRVLALNCGDWVNRMGAADSPRAGFREAIVLHLPFPDELLHGPRNILNGDVGIDAVLV